MILQTKKSLLVNTHTVSQMTMRVNHVIASIVYTIPLQLLSHYKAVIKAQMLTNHAIRQSRLKILKSIGDRFDIKGALCAFLVCAIT